MSHWASAYIGVQWRNGEEDCYGLVRRVYREQFRLALPVVDVNAISTLAVARVVATFDRSDWIEVQTPQDGDVIQMGHAKRPHHVGVWIEIDGGKILHSTESFGAIAQTPSQAKANGWKILNIYRHKSRCSPQ